MKIIPAIMRQFIGLVVGFVLCLTLLIQGWPGFATTPPARVFAVVEQAPALSVVHDELVATPVLHYQARLLDPANNQPKADGVYPMTFSLYNVATGGTALWAEQKNLSVANGRFATLLGDSSPLNLGLFNGQELWLGVQVAPDPEATPRQRIAHAAYAIYAQMAAVATTATSAANADKVDGLDATAFAQTGHNHDAAYVNTTGDTMSGPLAVPRIAYTAPRTHYLTIGSEGFVPGSNVDYVNTYGQGDAYLYSGSGALVANVALLQGANVTQLTVYFNDTSTSDMSVSLDSKPLLAGYFVTMANVTSSGTGGRYSRTVSVSGKIDNVNNSYLIYAWSDSWNSNLRLKGVVITYTLDEAP